MRNNLTLYGHAYTRVFTFTENGVYNEFKANGGIYLLHNILNPDTDNNHIIHDGLDRVYFDRLRRKPFNLGGRTWRSFCFRRKEYGIMGIQ